MNTLLIVAIVTVAILGFIGYKMNKQQQTAYYDDVDEDDGNDVNDFGANWNENAEYAAFIPGQEEDDIFFYVDPRGDLKIDFLHPI